MDNEDFLKKQLQNLNKHLPRGRATLKELLEKEKPLVESRNGSTHRFKKKELERLADILPENKHSKLRLPIIIKISPGLGRGAAKISGKTEQEVLREILDKEPDEDEEELLIYRPEVRVVRRELPTTTQYAFLISSKRGGSIDRTR